VGLAPGLAKGFLRIPAEIKRAMDLFVEIAAILDLFFLANLQV
jgi:hypothetical protein